MTTFDSERAGGVPERALTGRIFDVRRFSTHDGAGIRTTVFFKGCPLRCAWCHNPEGIDFARRPVWFAGRCVRCGACAQAAPEAVRLAEDGVRLDPSAPADWEAVMDACPSAALRWDSRDVTAEELFAEIGRDAPFFAHGGGVTLSGGDPLAQPEFARRLLEKCREAGFHTAVETELYAPEAALRGTLPLCDLIYADLKLFDAQAHIRCTGADNARILANFGWLLSGGLRDRVIVRTPLIPGMTATEANLTQIGAFLAERCPGVRWELLNYNPLAAGKYPMLGRKYALPEGTPRYNAAQMEAFREIARAAGVRNLIVE